MVAGEVIQRLGVAGRFDEAVQQARPRQLRGSRIDDGEAASFGHGEAVRSRRVEQVLAKVWRGKFEAGSSTARGIWIIQTRAAPCTWALRKAGRQALAADTGAGGRG